MFLLLRQGARVTTEVASGILAGAGMRGSTDKGRGRKGLMERNTGRGRESWPLWDTALRRKHRLMRGTGQKEATKTLQLVLLLHLLSQ